jgi:hypothetical protein
MLQAQLIQPLLLQLLGPAEELSSLLPLSASLISLELQKPLLSCISKAAMEQDKFSTKREIISNGIHSNTNVSDSNSNSDFYSNSIIAGHNEDSSNEYVPLLKPTENDNITDKVHNFGSTSTDIIRNSEDDLNGNINDDPGSSKSRIEELQRKIDILDENYNSDYINANVNPIDNLNILSLMVIRDWTKKTDTDQWKVYSFGKYRLYMHAVNEKYTLLLCTTMEYPSMLAISRLDNASKILFNKL